MWKAYFTGIDDLANRRIGGVALALIETLNRLGFVDEDEETRVTGISGESEKRSQPAKRIVRSHASSELQGGARLRHNDLASHERQRRFDEVAVALAVRAIVSTQRRGKLGIRNAHRVDSVAEWLIFFERRADVEPREPPVNDFTHCGFRTGRNRPQPLQNLRENRLAPPKRNLAREVDD